MKSLSIVALIIAAALAGCVSLGSASAQSLDYSDPVVACYFSQSIAIGTASCHDGTDPSAISVFRACSPQEHKAAQQSIEDSGIYVADPMLHHYQLEGAVLDRRDALRPYVLRWLRSAQQAPGCRNSHSR
jgi:hypothetical protein